MLVVQPTSTCDVCLERYIWNTTTNASGNAEGNAINETTNANELFTRPHVITCGHVFCYQCLQNIRTPRTCPLCRASFHLQRAVRIHVDVDPTSDVSSQHCSSIIGDDGSSDDNRTENGDNGSRLRLRLTREEAEVRELEVRLVRAFASAVDLTPGLGSGSRLGSAPTATSRSTSERGGDSADGDGGANEEAEGGEGGNDVEARRTSVLEEARAWLVNANALSDAHPILRSLIVTLPSYVALPTIRSSLERTGQENSRLRGERDQLRRHLRRAERVREQEAVLSRSSEKSYLAKVEEIERDCEQKLTQARADRLRLEDELARIKVALKDAQATQSDILVQAQMQIREQNQSQAHNSVPAPPYSPRPQEQQPNSQNGPSTVQGSSTQTSNPNSTSEILFPRTSSPPSTSAQVQQTQQARNPTSTSVSTSAYAGSYDYPQSSSYSYDYSHRHNPLPPPPEPVPLSFLPAFARPKPGSRAYTNAKALARHGTRRDRDRDTDRERERDGNGDGSETRRSLRRKGNENERSVPIMMTDSEKDRRERRRERERQRERERERGRADTETGGDSATSRDRLRGRPSGKDRDKEKEKEKDRGTDKGTDTSATETQERRRARTRHASLVGMASSPSAARQYATDPYTAYDYAGTSRYNERPSGSSVNVPSSVDTDAQEDANINRMPAVPRDVVGGWGLERSWRASYASSHSGNSVRSGHSGNAGPLGASGASASASASLEDLQDGLGEIQEMDNVNGSLGSSFTKMKVRQRERDRDRERDAQREAEDVIKDKGKGKERERHRDDGKEDYVFVHSTRDETDGTQPESFRRPRERHVSFTNATSSHPFPSTSDASANTNSTEFHDTTHELPPLQPYSHSSYSSYAQSHSQSQTQRGERERRTTLSTAPSALGLVLVPSPDGKGGYTYEYQYRYYSPARQQNQYQAQYSVPTLPPQSAIYPPSSTGSAMAGAVNGKEAITPLAALVQTQTKAYTGRGRSVNMVGGGAGNIGDASNASRASEYATLTRRATDSALRTHSQARAGSVMNNSATADTSTAVSGTRTGATPLHVPQPRRVSLTIPEPESETSPLSQAQQSQSFPPEGSDDVSVGRAFANTNTGRSHYTSNQPREQRQQQQQAGARMTSLSSSTNPNANMSLDSALASLSLGASSATAVSAPAAATTSTSTARQPQTQPQADMQAQAQTQTLRHRTSNSSTASASSGGISLTGVTKGERRKQLLDALFSVSSSSEDIGRGSGRVVPEEAGGGSAVASGSGGGDGRHGSEASKTDARVGASTSMGMNSSWSGDGKRVSLGRVLDSSSTTASTSGTAAMNSVVNDAARPTGNASFSQGHARAHNQTHRQSQGQAQAQAPRGVPSRDGRPPRGLSTRPSTTQPVSSSYGHYQQHQHQQQYVTSGYPATQTTQFRQATYPAAAYNPSTSIAQTQGQAGAGTIAYAYPTATVAYQVPGAYANAHVHVPATYSAGYYAAGVPHSAVRR